MNNPVKWFLQKGVTSDTGSRMTITGTLNKIVILFFSMGAGVGIGWMLYSTQSPYLLPLFWAAFIGALISALISIFSPEKVRYTAVPYAFGQGIVLSISAFFLEVRYPGIPVAAVSLTLATACAMLLLYRLELIKVTDRLRSMVVTATIAVAATYGLVLLMGLFGFNTGLFFESASMISMLFSLFVVGLASFNLLLDFDLIEQGEQRGFPQYMEWYGAFSFLVTLIWLYLEILRLLIKLSNRRK